MTSSPVKRTGSRQRAGCWRRALSWGAGSSSFLFAVLSFWCGCAEGREERLPGVSPEGSENTKRCILKNAISEIPKP